MAIPPCWSHNSGHRLFFGNAILLDLPLECSVPNLQHGSIRNSNIAENSADNAFKERVVFHSPPFSRYDLWSQPTCNTSDVEPLSFMQNSSTIRQNTGWDVTEYTAYGPMLPRLPGVWPSALHLRRIVSQRTTIRLLLHYLPVARSMDRPLPPVELDS